MGEKLAQFPGIIEGPERIVSLAPIHDRVLALTSRGRIFEGRANASYFEGTEKPSHIWREWPLPKLATEAP